MGDTRLSPARRAADRARLADEVVDVLVVGGGLSGAWVALDAAVRGLAVGLLEAHDWAAGSSGRPAVLLSRAGTPVRTALRERSRLLRTAAPHLVRPVPLVCPRPTPALSDVLARGLPPPRPLSRRAALAAVPALRPGLAAGALRRWDAQVDGARLTLAVVRTAAGYGARVLTRARVTGLLRAGDAVIGAQVADRTDGSALPVRARSVVLAIGADGGGLSGAVPAHPVVQVVLPRSAVDGRDDGLVLPVAGGALTVVPAGERWVVSHPGPDLPALLGALERALVRPVPASAVVAARVDRLPRGDGVSTRAPGLVVLAGGPATARGRAADAVDAATANLPGVPPSRTAHLPLVGAHRWADVRDRAPQLAADAELPLAAVGRLLQRHGDRVADVLDLVRADPRLGRPLSGAPGWLAAEVVHAVTAEGALSLDDVLARRTPLSGADPAEVAALVAGPLGWDAARAAREVASAG
ncbi:glycerol-3-phosphate dehydrogenase [Geodermatophilus africanus]|uniref:Glycerol-3-phosphate dehydrogenase n=1 Tax=Geodermatophilus africanus TaxID=1137993 RepID=A0A1H3ECB1_9ACTN|nr:FAD-dependent oxidoreductase [Geodermatophilus africanus]SDX76230.1 glycerol-3-phosphate dehydrogenase [Geodermatophilus africanus]